MGVRFAVRDTLTLILAVLAWSFVLTSGSEATLPWQVAAGVLGGACSYFAHEWGHIAGAAATGSRFAFSPSLVTPFTFRFDAEANSKRQFFFMSTSGFAVSFVVLGLLLSQLPAGLLATRITLGIAFAGLALTLFIEFPLLVYVMRGGQVPKTTVFDVPGEPGTR